MVDLITYDINHVLDCEFRLRRYESVSPEIRMFLVGLYSLTSFMSFTGNLLVIIVEVYGKKSHSHLRKYLINLAIADMLAGVLCVPFGYIENVYSHWPFPHILCSVVQFVQFLSVFVSSLTLTVIGVERYLAVVFPLTSYSYICSHSYRILFLIWVLGAAYSWYGIRQLVVYSFQLPPLDEPESDTSVLSANVTWYSCRIVPDKIDWELKAYIILNYLFTFILPLIVICFSYFAIIRRLMTAQFNEPEFRRNLQRNETSKIIKMMVIIVVLFAACWTPIKTDQLVRIFFPGVHSICSMASYYVVVAIKVTGHWLAMAHCFVNPIVYSFMSRSFRADLCDLTAVVCQKIHRRWRGSNSNMRATESITQQTNIKSLKLSKNDEFFVL